MRVAALRDRRNFVGVAEFRRKTLIAAVVLTWVATQSAYGLPAAFAEESMFSEETKYPAANTGSVLLEETTSTLDPKLTWKVLRRALERVRQGRLDEADRWLMYAMRHASSDPLLEVLDDRGHLAKGLSLPASTLSPENCEVRVLQALIQTRLDEPRKAIESLRFVEKTFPKYHSMNQVKSRIRAIDLILNPPKQTYAYEPRELSPKELQEILDRIARDKVAVSENQKTLEQALAEANEEQKEKYSRWSAKSYPLKVYVPTDVQCAKIPGYAAGDRNILIAAFQLWQKTMKERIKFVFVDTTRKADISCEWVDHPNKLGSNSKDAVGTCHKGCDSLFAIVIANIRILTLNTKDAAPNGAGYRSKYLRNVALHEIGHALGLDHLPNQKSIMYFQLQDPLLPSLTADDITAMQEIVVATDKETARNAKLAAAKPKLDAANSSIASAKERILTDEETIRHLVANVDSQLKAAKDLERFRLWDQAFSFYNDAFKYRPKDEGIRQNICRVANNAGLMALRKERKTQAVEFFSRGRELMNKQTPLELRKQILENLRQTYEANSQTTEAAEVKTILQTGDF